MSKGRGPTRLMSPRRTLTSSGNSSRLVARRNAPSLVRRRESGSSAPCASRASRIVRNLQSVNGRSWIPGRCCLKITGLPRLARTASATSANTGDNTMRAGTVSARSNARFQRRRIVGATLCLTVAAIVLAPLRRRVHRPTRHLDDLIERDRRRAAGADGAEPCAELVRVSLVLRARSDAPGDRASPIPQSAPVVDGHRAPIEEAFDPLLGVGARTRRYIMNGGNRTFPEAEGERGDIVYGAAVVPVCRRRVQRDDGPTREGTREVDEVAGFADDAAAALLLVLGPMVARNGAGVDGDDGGQRAAASGELALQLHRERRKAAVEADHEHAVRRARGIGDAGHFLFR